MRVLEYLLPVILILGWSTVVCQAQEGYYDQTITGDRRSVFEFLDGLEAELAPDGFGSIPYDYATYLAERMGEIDRDGMTGKVFQDHIQLTVEHEADFYSDNPLSTDEIKQYLLPLRIRAEYVSRPNWKRYLLDRIGPDLAASTTADERAWQILRWIHDHVDLMDLGETYILGLRGDLDPITTIRGGRGTELDCTVLGIAALRTFGVAARYVYVPVVQGGEGGKAWLQFLGEDREWKSWVPSQGATPGDHHSWICEHFQGRVPMVFANADEATDITALFWETTELTSGPRPLGADMQTSFHIFSREMLQQAFGTDYRYFDGPHEQTFGPCEVWIGAGYRSEALGLQRIRFQQGKAKTWFIFDFPDTRMEVREGEEVPPVFREMGVDTKPDQRPN